MTLPLPLPLPWPASMETDSPVNQICLGMATGRLSVHHPVNFPIDRSGSHARIVDSIKAGLDAMGTDARNKFIELYLLTLITR